ncbi:MAG: tetratricopeptide repeat protein [Phycisphaerales bacterium]|nr:tetratricopeptide repeat protein [Phycisphaerales bacterium]
MVFTTACTHRPSTSALLEKGDFAYEYERYDEAARHYGMIVENYPGDWEGQYKLGLTLLELDRPEEARRALEVAMTSRPRDNDIADALAEAIYRTGDEADLFTFLNGQARETQTVYAHTRIARYAMYVGDPDTAKVAMETAIEIDGGRTAQPYLDAAIFAEELGDLDVAVRRLRQAYAIDPNNVEVRRRLIALGEVPGPTLGLPPGR